MVAYFAIKQEFVIVNYMILAYVLFIGTLTLKKYLYKFFQSQDFLTGLDFPIKFLLPLRISMTKLELLCLSLSAYFVILYLQTEFHVANNVIGMSIAIFAIESWLVGSFLHIAIIFAGLICYDVFFVFHTEVMVTVAKGLDMPVKLEFPLNQGRQTMIGLGDIIIPGLLCSMCLRYDLIQAFNLGRAKAIIDNVKDRAKLAPYIKSEFRCHYFNTSLLAYIVGLAATFF